MPVTSLFRGLAEERDAVFVKAGHGPEIVRQGTRAGHRYQLLGTLRGPHKVMEPLVVTLTERSEMFPLFQHPGVEMLYMLKGSWNTVTARSAIGWSPVTRCSSRATSRTARPSW